MIDPTNPISNKPSITSDFTKEFKRSIQKPNYFETLPTLNFPERVIKSAQAIPLVILPFMK